MFQTQIYEDDKDDCVDGAMIVPIILGADKTTVSVATGHVKYHPLYLSIGNVTNSARQAHRNAVIPIGFPAIPKCELSHIVIHCYSFHMSFQRTASMTMIVIFASSRRDSITLLSPQSSSLLNLE